jgi:hypothetical protein
VVAKRVVVALVPVRLVMNADAIVAPTAERLVVEALVIDAFVTVRSVMNAEAIFAPVMVVVPTKSAPIVPEAAEKSVVDAVVIVVVARVVVPVTTSVNTVVVARVVEPVNVLSPAKVWVVVDMKPRAVADASGMLNVCVPAEETMLKSVPVVPIANSCTVSERPFNESIPPVAEPVSMRITSPFVFTESATPLKVDVAEF